MHKFGLEHLDKSLKMFSNKRDILHLDVQEVLRQFQDGYTRRDLENVDAFMKELFIIGDDTCVLGTGTGELFLGSEKVKKVLQDDWKYWGDVNIDWESARISTAGDVAWFATTGSVKHIFKDLPNRDNRYLDFIKEKAGGTGLTPKQKITLINWVLALSYHQRIEKKREYLWPLRLTGVLLKDSGKWKKVHLHFSIPIAIFPDERFENCPEHLENYNNQNALVNEYKSNQMTTELKDLLTSLETTFVVQTDVRKIFAWDGSPYIISPDNQWFQGIDQIQEFFTNSEHVTLSLDLDHVIARKSNDITWVTVTGKLKQDLTEDQLMTNTLEELNNIFQADLTAKEKLFATQRSIAYVLKETASGTIYTCPIRLTAVILNQRAGPVFHQIHFSYPNYWVLEGKINGILST